MRFVLWLYFLCPLIVLAKGGVEEAIYGYLEAEIYIHEAYELCHLEAPMKAHLKKGVLRDALDRVAYLQKTFPQIKLGSWAPNAMLAPPQWPFGSLALERYLKGGLEQALAKGSPWPVHGPFSHEPIGMVAKKPLPLPMPAFLSKPPSAALYAAQLIHKRAYSQSLQVLFPFAQKEPRFAQWYQYIQKIYHLSTKASGEVALRGF